MNPDDQRQKRSAFSSRGGGALGLRGRQQARAILQRAAGRSGRAPGRGRSAPNAPASPRPVGQQLSAQQDTDRQSGKLQSKSTSVFQRLSQGTLQSEVKGNLTEGIGQSDQQRTHLHSAKAFGSPTGPSNSARSPHSVPERQAAAAASPAATVPPSATPLPASASTDALRPGISYPLHGAGGEAKPSTEQFISEQLNQLQSSPLGSTAQPLLQQLRPAGTEQSQSPFLAAASNAAGRFGLFAQPAAATLPSSAAGMSSASDPVSTSAATITTAPFGQPSPAAFPQQQGPAAGRSQATQPSSFVAAFAAQQAASPSAASSPAVSLFAGAKPFFPASQTASTSQPPSSLNWGPARTKVISFGPQAAGRGQGTTQDLGRGQGRETADQPFADLQAPSPSSEPLGEEEGGFDYETERRKALAAMPTFAGVQGASGQRPSAQARPTAVSSSAFVGTDADDAARKQQRAARFGDTHNSLPQSQQPQQQPPLRLRRAGTPDREPLNARLSGTDEGSPDVDARFGSTVGTCEAMCPDSEVQRRINMDDFDELEQPLPGDARTSAQLAVKRFARTIVAGAMADFRTQGALLRTQAHLRSILNRTDKPFANIFGFVWDRFRGMRQDMYVQGMQDLEAMSMYEEHVRFMILGEHELCHVVATANNPEGHNSHLNIEQMNKALVSLQAMYTRMADQGKPAPNEAEFRAYQLMLSMGTHGKYFYSAASFFASLKRCPPEVLATLLVQQVIALHRALHSGSHVQFFKLVAQLPYLPACLCHAYFQDLRKLSVSTLHAAGAPAARARPPDLQRLQRELCLEDAQEAADICRSAGLPVGLAPDKRQLQTSLPHQDQDLHGLNEAVPRQRSALIAAKAPAVVSAILTSPGGSASNGAATAGTSPFGMPQRATFSAAGTRGQQLQPTAWRRQPSQPAPQQAQPAAHIAPGLQQLPQSMSAATTGLQSLPGGWGAAVQMAMPQVPSSTTSASFSYRSSTSPGAFLQPNSVSWGQQPAHTPSGPAMPSATAPALGYGLPQPQLPQPDSDDAGHQAAAAAAARRHEQQQQQARAEAEQRERERHERKVRQQREAAEQQRLQLDRRRQEEEAAQKLRQEREEAQAHERQRRQQQEQAEARARAAAAAREREQAAQQRAAELERQRLEQAELDRQAQREQDMLARWRRYQAARAIHAWRVATAEAKRERAIVHRQEAALRGCRASFSPLRLPLAEAFDGLQLTSSSATPATPMQSTGDLPPVARSPRSMPSPGLRNQPAGPLELAQLLASTLAERSLHADELFWKAAVLVQPQSVIANHMRCMLLPPSRSEPARCGGSMHVSHRSRALAASSQPAVHVAAIDASIPTAQPQLQQDCTSAAMEGTSAVILLLDNCLSSAGRSPAGQRQTPPLESRRSDHSAWLAQRLQAMADRLPAELSIPVLAVVCGVAALGPEDEAQLKGLLPRGPNGQLRLEPWAVFLAQSLEEAGEALSQGLQWLAEHGPPQPDIKAVATDRLAHGLFQRRLQRRSTASAAQAWQEAYHAALEDVKSAVAAGRSSIACKWHWPPPESRDPGRVHHPGSWPAVWWQEQASDDLSGALEAAALPSLQHTTDEPVSIMHWASKAGLTFVPTSLASAVQAAVHVGLGSLAATYVPTAVIPTAVAWSVTDQCMSTGGRPYVTG